MAATSRADQARAYVAASQLENVVEQMMYLDAKSYLQDSVLVKVDRASMAVGLEVRCPLLDHTLVEFLASLPLSYKLRGTKGKYLLKRIAKKFLPRKTIHRRKQGFAMPVAAWLRTSFRELLEDMLASDRLERAGIFRPDVIRALLDDHVAGRRDNHKFLLAVVDVRVVVRRILSVPGNVVGQLRLGMSDSFPFTYVVVLTFNGKQFLDSCFQDAVEDGLSECAVLLVDNGSTEDLASYIKERFPEVETLRLETNVGAAGGANAGIAYAIQRGADYVALCHDDVVMVAPRWLDHAARQMQLDARVGIVGFQEAHSQDEIQVADEVRLTSVEYAIGFAVLIAQRLCKISRIRPTLRDRFRR